MRAVMMKRMARAQQRQGVTLIEMLIALAILIVLVSLTYPSSRRLLLNYDLKEASQGVRDGLGRARNRAVREGVTYQALFELNGQWFVIIPQDTGLSSTAGTETTNANLANTTSDTIWKLTGKLPEDLEFRYLTDSQVMAAPVSPEMFAGLSNASDLAQVQWGPAIMFRPDGTADDAVIEIFHPEQKRLVQVYIRGLTGAVSLSGVMEESER